MKATLIKDSQRFNAAKSQWGNSIKTYDDGFGPLWIHRGSLGVTGIVRAQNFATAHSICEDEFFPEADESMEEIVREYGFKREHVKIVRDETGEHEARFPEDYPDGKLLDSLQFVRWETRETPDPEAWADNELFQDSFGFRPNGARVGDVHKHGIYAKDLNGDSLELLTPQLVADLGIVLDIASEFEVFVDNIGCVYSGHDEKQALADFAEYCEQSKSGYGRASGEKVELLKDGEPLSEYLPPEEEQDTPENRFTGESK